MGDLGASARDIARVRAGRRRVQRRRRLVVPRVGRQRHARARASELRDRGVAVVGVVRARRLRRVSRPSGACNWIEVETDRDGERGLSAQRRRPLLLVQGRVDGCARAASRDERDAVVVLGVNVDDLGDHRPGQRAAAQRGARFPLVDAGFTKSEVRAVFADARAEHLGQAGRGVPRVATSRTARRWRSGCWPRSRQPSEGCATSVSATCACATIATSPASRCRLADLDALLSGARAGRRQRSRPRGIATSRSTSKVCARAISTPRSVRRCRMNDDDQALATYGDELVRAVESALGEWVESCVRRVLRAQQSLGRRRDGDADRRGSSRRDPRGDRRVARRPRARRGRTAKEPTVDPAGAVRYPTQVLRAVGCAAGRARRVRRAIVSRRRVRPHARGVRRLRPGGARRRHHVGSSEGTRAPSATPTRPEP